MRAPGGPLARGAALAVLLLAGAFGACAGSFVPGPAQPVDPGALLWIAVGAALLAAATLWSPRPGRSGDERCHRA